MPAPEGVVQMQVHYSSICSLTLHSTEHLLGARPTPGPGEAPGNQTDAASALGQASPSVSAPPRTNQPGVSPLPSERPWVPPMVPENSALPSAPSAGQHSADQPLESPPALTPSGISRTFLQAAFPRHRRGMRSGGRGGRIDKSNLLLWINAISSPKSAPPPRSPLSLSLPALYSLLNLL